MLEWMARETATGVPYWLSLVGVGIFLAQLAVAQWQALRSPESRRTLLREMRVARVVELHQRGEIDSDVATAEVMRLTMKRGR